MLLIGGIVTSLVALMLNQREIAALTLFLALLPVLALLIHLFTPPRLNFSRELSTSRTSVGDCVEVILNLDMKRFFSPVLLQFEDVVDPRLGQRPWFSSQRITGPWHRSVNYRLSAHTRGVFAAGPFLVRSSDALGLTHVDRVIHQRDEVIVTPRVFPLPPARLGAGGISGGEQRPHRLGMSGHDDALVREHREGEGLRRVHWRSTAKRGTLMVRNEESAFDESATILLDSRGSAHLFPERFEWAVSAVTSFALQLIDQGYRVTVIDTDGPRILPIHDTPLASREDVILAMTRQRLSHATTLDHWAMAKSGAVIAILGRASRHDIAPLLTSHGKKGWAFLLDSAPEAAETLLRQGWRVLRVPTEMSVDMAWRSIGGLT